MTIHEMAKLHKYLNKAVTEFTAAHDAVKGSCDSTAEYLEAANRFHKACHRLAGVREMMGLEDTPETLTEMVLMAGSEERFLFYMTHIKASKGDGNE